MAGKGETDLEALGVTAVDAEAVEHDVLARATHDAVGQGSIEPDGLDAGERHAEDRRQELEAVEHELNAVRDILVRLDEEADAAPAADDQDAWSSDEEGPAQQQLPSTRKSGAAAAEDSDEASGAAGAGIPADTSAVQNASQLQKVVMQQRLVGLESRQKELQEAVQQSEQEAAGGPAGSSGGDASSKQQPPQAARKAAAKPVNLEEDDMFDAAVRPRHKPSGAGGSGSGFIETERDRLIRTGVITPFDRLDGFERSIRQPARQTGQRPGTSGRPVDPEFARVAERTQQAHESKHLSKLVDHSELPRRERGVRRMDEGFWRQTASGHAKASAAAKRKRKSSLQRPTRKRLRKAAREARGSDGSSSESDASDGEEGSDVLASEDDVADLTGEFDDADDEAYKARVEHYETSHSAFLDESEDVVFEGGFTVPAEIWNRLYDYQKTGVKWLWELHTQRAGGIVGDEMGLGKTIQLVSFLAGLHRSGRFRPSLIVCPATVLRQWLRELRSWYPPFRIVILHDSARSAMGTRPSRAELVQSVAHSEAGILVTTYEHLRLRHAEILPVRWGYAILDEGHKIRNPDAEVTLMAKQLQTVHRVIMTGTPVQNRLPELWSLFDFVFPGKLGTLPVFQTQFAIPIQIGGYANASSMQVSTAYKCAVVLRDLIAPYLLRRRKTDVEAELPKKTEQVLFCRMTSDQRDLYKAYLASKDVEAILAGDRNALAGIDVLRKICNHPDLLQRTTWESAEDYGAIERSGKMLVIVKVLRAWHDQGHRALVFTQTQQMLDIVEKTIAAEGYKYHRMDGSTPVGTRMRLMDDFNESSRTFAFLLTTKVGGIGVNLTGADRVLIVDPDWNPATDMQARERAWRIGQTKPVTVYRLITSGTIEEKVYHRQIYKQFLTNKVLQDPRQKRFFKAKDMSDLFTLGSEYATGTETATIFAGLNGEVVPDASPAATPSDAAADGSASPPQPSEWQDDSGASTPASAPESGSRRSSSARRRRPVQQQGKLATSSSLSGVVSSDSDAAPSGEGNPPGEDHDDAHILRELFDGGVMGALDHNKIEGANDPTQRAVEAEASRVARRAAEALRQSRASIQGSAINQPTWTGHSGAAGAPPTAGWPRFGTAVNPALRNRLAAASGGMSSAGAATASGGDSGGSSSNPFSGRTSQGLNAGVSGGQALRSADLLAQLRQRNASAAAAGLAEANGNAEDAEQLRQAKTLTQQICDFLEAAGSRAPTADVIQHFADRVPASNMSLFRQLLKQVANLKRIDGAKLWVLKDEYRVPQ